MKPFAEWLKLKMESQHLGVNQLAAGSGVSRAMVSSILSGGRNASYRSINKFARYFQEDLDHLLLLAGLRHNAPEKEWEEVEDTELRALLTAENINSLSSGGKLAITSIIRGELERKQTRSKV